MVWHPNKAGVARSGDMGYTVGSYDLKMKDTSGKPVLDTGKYITIWKKHADGSWKVIYDMFNTDQACRPLLVQPADAPIHGVLASAKNGPGAFNEFVLYCVYH